MPDQAQGLCTVLLVEDDGVIAFDLQDVLEEKSYRVAGPVPSCRDALAWLEENTPDVAVIDFEVRDGSCEPLADELTRRGVPWVVYSGWPQDCATSPIFRQIPWVQKPALAYAVPDAIASVLESRAGP